MHTCIRTYMHRVLGFSRIYVQHRRWDFHEDAEVKTGKETISFQTGPRTAGIDEGTLVHAKP